MKSLLSPFVSFQRYYRNIIRCAILLFIGLSGEWSVEGGLPRLEILKEDEAFIVQFELEEDNRELSLQWSSDLVNWSNEDLVVEETEVAAGRVRFSFLLPLNSSLDDVFFRIFDEVFVSTELDCADCDYVMDTDEFFLDNDVLGLPVGSVIGIRAGDRVRIDLKNFHGTEEAPFIFTNCGGQVILNIDDSPEAVRIRNSSNLRLTGTGSSEFYGIKVETGSQGVRAYEKTDRIEIDHLEISGVAIGVWVVTRPTCDGESNQESYHMEGIIVHDNYIHDVDGEGTYIGGSKWENGYDDVNCPDEKLLQPDLFDVKVYDNIVERTGWDGIQVGGAIGGCEIYNNIVRDYGLRETTIHQAGVMINPGTTGKIYANVLEGGTGNAIHLLGFDNLVFSNLVIDCALNAVHIGDRAPLAEQSYRIVNNTFVNVAGRVLHMNSGESVDNVFYNNFMVNVADEELFTVIENTDFSNNLMVASFDGYEFVDLLNLDFTPVEGSNLIDMGVPYVRDELEFDRKMRSRLVGTTIDIGAFEYQSE